VLNGTIVSEFVAKNFFYGFLALVALTVYERRMGKDATRKRMASLIQAVAVFLMVVAASGVMEFGGSDLHLFGAILVIGVVLGTVLRDRAFPYRRTCPSCNAALDFKTIMFRDDHLCEKCRPKDPETDDNGQEAAATEDESDDWPEVDEE
jgi:hypothetical protein